MTMYQNSCQIQCTEIQIDKIESLVAKLQKEQHCYLSRETNQQNSISALVDRIKSLEECVSKMEKALMIKAV